MPPPPLQVSLDDLTCPCPRPLPPPQVPLDEFDFPTSKISNVQSQLERLVEKNYYLHQSARDAYRCYLLAYNSHQLKEIFNVHRLDLQVRVCGGGGGEGARVGRMPGLLLHVCMGWRAWARQKSGGGQGRSQGAGSGSWEA